jgi:hypothetical protein
MQMSSTNEHNLGSADFSRYTILEPKTCTKADPC